ncbi:MAG TPA: hypothetical protein VK644_04005 [Chitinophagaceae bacterium]|nr:hypothetical protein [Chitinophagaceae bacterium]
MKRKPFQGVANVIRFNWHFYAIGAAIIVGLFFLAGFMSPFIRYLVQGFGLLSAISIVASLLVSHYVYDRSGLYSMQWLSYLSIHLGERILNVHAGFDETSELIKEKYPDTELMVFDFYDPVRHTEVSIRRARKAYPAYPDTIPINTNALPPTASSIDYIFLILAAHEIREKNERIHFFSNLSSSLSGKGRIIVVEHTRDINNFLAYNVGCLHFLSRKSWNETFSGADLDQVEQFKLNPFISCFILKSNGSTS